MEYKVNLEGFEGQNVTVNYSFWTGTKLYVNGERAPRGKKWGQMTLRRNDGSEVAASWKPQMLGFDIPQLVVDGKTIVLVEPLKWYEAVWAGAPILLIFGGLLGAIAGVIGFFINSTIFRSKMDNVLKYVVAGIVNVVVVAAYFVMAIIFSLAINR